MNKCVGCGHITGQWKCEKCGYRSMRIGAAGKLLIVVFGVLLIAPLLGKSNTPTPSGTAAQVESPAVSQETVRFGKAAYAGRVIKENLREPDSVQWSKILSNEDGSVLCFVYRARNGFGGVSIERAVAYNEEVSLDESIWNKKCAGKEMYDMTRAQQAIY